MSNHSLVCRAACVYIFIATSIYGDDLTDVLSEGTRIEDTLKVLDDGAAATSGLDDLLSDTPVDSPVPAAPISGGLDDLLLDAPAAESAPVDKASPAPVDALDDLLGAPAVAEPVAAPTDALDDLLGAPAVAEPVAAPADTLDDLLGDPVAAPADTLDGLLAEPGVGSDPLDTLIAEPSAAMPDAGVGPIETLPGATASAPLVDGDAFLDSINEAGAPDAAGADVMIREQGGPISELMHEEMVRRRAQLLQGRANYKLGLKHLQLGQSATAAALFNEAILLLAKNPNTVDLWSKSRLAFAEAKYRYALSLFRLAGTREALDKSMEEVLTAIQYDRNHTHAYKLEKEIIRAKERIEAMLIAPTKRVPRKSELEYQKLQFAIADFMNRGHDFFELGEYIKAQSQFEGVLALDPSNSRAIRALYRVSEARHQSARDQQEATAIRMTHEVTEHWNPGNFAEIITDRKMIPVGGLIIPENERLRRLMDSVIIPEISFKNASIEDVVEFLVEESKAAKPPSWKEEDDFPGVSIILNLGNRATRRPAAAAAADPDPFGGGDADPFATGGGDADPFAVGGGGAAPAPAVGAGYKVSFDARRISLREALEIIVDMSNLKYQLKKSYVMIVPADTPVTDLVNRSYTVEPTLIDALRLMVDAKPKPAASGFAGSDPFADADAGEGVGGGDPNDIKKMFELLGVEWPTGSNVSYVEALSKIFVLNTIDNLAALERVLVDLNVVPSQVEIVTRFVEVAQTDLNELGFQWLLTDDWEVATRAGQGARPFSNREQVKVNSNASRGGFSRGLRWFGFDEGQLNVGPAGAGTVGDILSVSSLLTNPEMTMVVHALEQSGRADTLSAPRITTMSGQDAEIKVVTEFIYPSEFDITPVSSTTPGFGGGAGSQSITGGLVEPGSFETREVGVILQVTPEVSPDGQRITLQMSPEVVTEPEWFDYGSVITAADGSQQVLNIQQPFFHTRRLTTTITIYNGATVVMGGMITEHLNTMDDRIPILGDLPLFGRLFRSKGESSVKRNLLIFVTARLVDPAGKPLIPEYNTILDPISTSE